MALNVVSRTSISSSRAISTSTAGCKVMVNTIINHLYTFSTDLQMAG